MTLTDFLLARIAEDEAVARPLNDGAIGGRASELLVDIDRDYSEPTGWVYIDPARVLAECAAKRAIARAYESADLGSGVDYELRFGLDLAVRALAAVYGDHADYRTEWR